jgi:NAD(P)-dependent dehydrogenase (short-subunit alcohol dehydrogenase family)
MNYYSGKTVLITGAYGGFGLQFIAQFLDSGSSLILSDVTIKNIPEALGPQLAKKLPTDLKKKIIAEIPADLSTTQGCRELYENCKKTGRPVDIIVHNAGIAYAGTLIDIPAELCDKVLAINLLSVMQLNKLAVKQIIHSRYDETRIRTFDICVIGGRICCHALRHSLYHFEIWRPLAGDGIAWRNQEARNKYFHCISILGQNSYHEKPEIRRSSH